MVRRVPVTDANGKEPNIKKTAETKGEIENVPPASLKKPASKSRRLSFSNHLPPILTV